jgi:hypothetical protein
MKIILPFLLLFGACTHATVNEFKVYKAQVVSKDPPLCEYTMLQTNTDGLSETVFLVDTCGKYQVGQILRLK